MPTRVLLVLIAIAAVTGFDASRKMSLVAALLKGGKCLQRKGGGQVVRGSVV